VQAIVADHSGRISVESEMGVGTAFHLELPVKPPHHANQTAPVVVAQVDEKKEED
jgi:signal transduction histidine kinase